MNKVKIYFQAFFLLTITLISGGYNITLAQESRGAITGRWKTDTDKILLDLQNDGNGFYDSLPKANKDNLKKSLETRVFEFSENGSFSAQWEFKGSMQSVKGSWKIGDKNNLFIYLPNGLTEYKILVLDKSRLALKPVKENDGFLKILFFTKASRL